MNFYTCSGLLEDNNHTSYVLILLMTIDVVVVFVLVVVLWGWPCPPFFIQGGRGYKESPRVSYNCNPSRTLSLVLPNYKIWSYANRTLSLGDILSSYCCNMGL
jgi:hypothetical protein